MYTRDELPQYVKTAGKVTVFTAFTGLLVFMVAFIFDLGNKEINQALAQNSATTTLRVLNTPPVFDVLPYEIIGSSTTTPTNSGDTVSWGAVATDSNGAPYFMIVCSTADAPTANSNAGTLGTAPPACEAPGAIQWGVSASTTSGDPVVVSTTTVDRNDSGGGSFTESNEWYAWVCDDDINSPQCSLSSQGAFATSTSPFNVNSRPELTSAPNDSPALPGDPFNFDTVAEDDDTDGEADTLFITVCDTNTLYSTSTNSCSDFRASSTVGTLTDPTVPYTVPVPTQDQSYQAFVYVRDQHGHEALAPIQSDFIVANATPTVQDTSINMSGIGGPGSDLTLTILAGETPSSTLTFEVLDDNSCLNFDSDPEISEVGISIFRSPFRATTTCSSTNASHYDPNHCYTSAQPPSSWDLVCTASSTSCAGAGDTSIEYSCTFPLWFVADPTDFGPFAGDDWVAAVQGADDNFATGTQTTTAFPRTLEQNLGLESVEGQIAYGDVAPGDISGNGLNLHATSVIVNVGNTALDQQVAGQSMCSTFSPSTLCPVDETSTIPAPRQRFGTSTFLYLGPETEELSSSTPVTLEIDLAKTTSTSTPNPATTYWGIEVPNEITFAGDYTGLNDFVAEVDQSFSP